MRKFSILIIVLAGFLITFTNHKTLNIIRANSFAFNSYLPIMFAAEGGGGEPGGGSGDFLETFDGDPSGPLSWSNVSAFDTWDVSVHRRSTDLNVQGIDAHHGPNCEAPPQNTHYNDTYDGSVFQCKNHVMTAINDSGYGAIYLTPNHILDFSNGQESIVRFDMSTLKTSTRDWISVWITPFEENLQLPIDRNVDLQGPPDNSVQFLMLPERSFIPKITRNGTTTTYRYGASGVTWWIGYDDFLVPDAQRRDTFEIRISQTHLKFCMPDYDFCWIDMDIDYPLTWDQGIVQFSHSSYNPTKDGAGVPNTWHWDNVEITSGTPFTIIQANRRYLDTNNNIVQFNEPAPIDAYLRFAAIGNNIEVSFNNGSTWETAQKNLQDNDENHFASYWTPIPEGTTIVKFRGDGWGNGGLWQARDLTIWSKVATENIIGKFEANNLFSQANELFTRFSDTNFCYIPEE